MDHETSTAPITQADASQEVHTALFTPEKEQAVLRRVGELNERSNMSIQELSRITHLSESTVVRYVTGKTKNPHLYTMVTLIVAMGGDIYEILGIAPPDDPVPVSAPVGNPYGELIESFREEAVTLRAAVESLVKDLDALTHKITGMSRVVAARTIALLIVVGVFCVLEIVDLCNPDWGRYQWAIELFQSFLHKV